MTDSSTYGLTQYGTGAVYGYFDLSQNSLIRWGLQFDYDGDFTYSDDNEAKYLESISISRGRQRSLAPQGGGFEPQKVGSMAIRLNNTSGRFDSWNANSPLFGKEQNEIYVRLFFSIGVSNTRTSVFTGIVTNIEQVRQNGKKYVSITANDFWRVLADRTCQIEAIAGASVTEILEAIVSVGDFPFSVETTVGTPIVANWWSANKPISQEIHELTSAFWGTAVFLADGSLAYRDNRNFDPSEAIALTEDELLKDVDIPQPIEYFRNYFKVQIEPTEVGLSNSQLYAVSAGGVTSIPVGATVSIEVPYTYNGKSAVATSVVTPVANVHYVLNTAANGSGTNLTSSCLIQYYNFATKGQYVITNNSGSTVYTSTLSVFGTPLTLAEKQVLVSPFSPPKTQRQFSLSSRFLQSANAAIDLLSVLPGFLSTARRYPIVRISDRPTLQFSLDLGKTVSLDMPSLGISGIFRIIGLSHKDSGSKTCQSMTTTIFLEPVFIQASWVWDDASTFDSETIFGF